MLEVVLVIKLFSLIFGRLERKIEEIIYFCLLRSYFKRHMAFFSFILFNSRLVADILEWIVFVLLIVSSLKSNHLIGRSLDICILCFYINSLHSWFNYPSCAYLTILFEILACFKISLLEG